MSKYFGKCFGPSTRAPKFSTRMYSFLLSKFATQLKLIQSVVQFGILGVCVTSSILRVLLSGFWVAGSQIPSSRDPDLGPGCQGPVSQGHRFPGPRVPGPESQDTKVPGLRVPGLGSQGPGSRVSGPDFRLWPLRP